ncbi:efflux transporter outer membrane subunit [Sphingomonas colocasiae]|uniref:Efflux transporter outer membrane subunit n=1 Tax=Sphingomonas colocasiae TaxID=1848973 RepID=A0ABS7PVK5_9SPHN|nr:efflux transporter outer membrane subunit [Sphingomonas colocasiae]MBY8825313.1 efflux transporter outer membrane subunit [Sphingomonas colocasiae]
MPVPPYALRSAPLIAMALAGCTVGPNHIPPETAAPADWSSWRSGDASLRLPVASDATLPPDWWRAFNDPVLDDLQQRAVAASPDLRTAALHVAQARVQRGATAAAGLPAINAGAGVTRQRQSENGAGTRLLDVVSGNSGGDRDTLAKLLAEPFTLYQGGLDAAWEIDLWGKVRRSLEAADADLAERAALLAQARLTLASDVTRTYLELRATQRKIAMTRQDIAALESRAGIVAAQVRRGQGTHLDIDRQQSELQGLRASLPDLLAQEGAQASQLGLLLGERPGALADLLKPADATAAAALPDIALGLPSELALRRPDIRAAEARLHGATARIGVATADLYPSIRLGGGFNLESYKANSLFDWASRSWSIGPSIDLPIFDGGRRRRVVQLRELEQREAAVAYQKTVLRAWQEIGDALNGYAAERQRNAALREKVTTSRDALDLASARYRGGITTYLEVIDAQRGWIQSTRDLADSDARIGTRYAAINKAIGNAPALADGDMGQGDGLEQGGR